MSLTLTTHQAARIATALRRGGVDSFRIADAIDAGGRTHFLIEVSDMGQFAKDWTTLKQIIKQYQLINDRHSDQIVNVGPLRP